MSRLAATIRADITLQYRNGFYYAVAIVAAIWILLLRQLPPANLAWLLPGLILGNLLVNAFYFISGLLLLEKGENTLSAQVMTPLRPYEYLAAKLLTLTFLSVLENSAIVLLAYGWGVRLLPFWVGLILASLLLALAGFLVVSRYDAINEFLLPSMLVSAVVLIPLLAYFANWDHWLLYLHPLRGPLLLLQSGWTAVSTGQWLYAILYTAFWIGLAIMWSERVWYRFIIASEGVG